MASYHTSVYRQEGDWSQRKQRRGQMFRDQWGRMYHGVIELKSMDTTGMIDPGFSAPLVTPMQYLERSRDPERPYDLFINYTRWETDIRLEREAWEYEARTMSRTLYGEKYDASSPDFTPQVLDLVGPPPQHVEPVIAARQGNPWVLGLTTVPDKRLVRFFANPRDVAGRERAEPDFRGHEPVQEPTAGSNAAVLDAALNASLADLGLDVEPSDRSYDAYEELEEEYDREAIGAQGGRRVPVSLPEQRTGAQRELSDTPAAIRKRAARALERQRRDQTLVHNGVPIAEAQRARERVVDTVPPIT